jgi:hypothetical protein
MPMPTNAELFKVAAGNSGVSGGIADALVAQERGLKDYLERAGFGWLNAQGAGAREQLAPLLGWNQKRELRFNDIMKGS